MQNIFKSICRNFIRKPATNLINLLGLAISLALVIILSVYSYSELTTDDFHRKGNRIYLCTDSKVESNYMPGILKDEIDLNIPEIESAIRIASRNDLVFQVGINEPINSDVVFADQDFFRLFTYHSIEGSLENALKEPMTVVLSKPLAVKLFGKERALGKAVKLNNDQELIVSAVVDDQEANSCLSFNAITSIETRKIVSPRNDEYTEWNWRNFQIFILLKEGISPEGVAGKVSGLFPKSGQNDNLGIGLCPLKEVYFSEFFGSTNSYLRSGDRKKVMILVLVAALVLLIAIVNFINISSSQWMEKIKQTGVMKVIGAANATILKSIISEAFILFLMSLILAILIILVIYPFIKDYTGININLHLLYSPSFLLLLVIGAFVLSTLFTIIPAIRISSSKAVNNLMKTVEPNASKSSFRGALVTVQFVIAIVLIAFTVLVQKQVNYGSSSLGFSHDNIVGIRLSPQLYSKKEVFRTLLQEKPSVEKISFTQFYPGIQNSHSGIELEINGTKRQLDFDRFNADADFYSLVGLQLIQGRFFSNDLTSEKHEMVVNEIFIRRHNLDNPIGLKFAVNSNSPIAEIVGVVKDFHYKSVSEPIASLVIQNEPNAWYCLVKLKTTSFNSMHHTIEEIKASAAKLSPSFPIEVSFFDQSIENMYQSELQFRRTFSLFAGSAIVICCLGILAMSMFACQRRIKEIGVRKVNGAKISEILTMLNRDFVKWVAIAFIIAIPIAYYIMNKWLESYAYKTHVSWWVFALAGLMALGIALLTVSFQSWKAATRNPVEALRYE